MGNITEKLERFNQLEQKVGETKNRKSELEVEIRYKKEEIRKLQEDLAEQGVTYDNIEELSTMYMEKHEKVEELLTKVETLFEDDGNGDTEEELMDGIDSALDSLF